MIEKLAETAGVSPQAMTYGLIGFAILAVLIFIKIHIDEKKGVNSQEKADVRKIITNLVPDGAGYTAAYAHSVETYGRRKVYHYYAIGFKPEETDHIWVVPIGVETGKIVYTEPMRLSAENVSYIQGNSVSLIIHFPDTKNLCILTVEASNTKIGKECQVNIQQPDEAAAFRAFAEPFRDRVNNTLGVDKKGRPLK